MRGFLQSPGLGATPPAGQRFMSDISKEVLAERVEQRRTFAIISHPDAGKTTLQKNCCFLRCYPHRRQRQGAQSHPLRHLGLDGNREATWHFGRQLGDADGVPGQGGEPARHARPPGLFRDTYRC